MREGIIQTVTFTVHRFDGAATRLWVLGQMALARPALAALEDCTFWKLCGSGTGEGFTPRPDPAVWAILACWPDAATARVRTSEAAVFRAWRDRARETWTVYLAPLSARGTWSGRMPFEVSGAPRTGPIAALTRATVRPKHLARFWARVPDISAGIGSDANVAFKIGIGEVPWLHQATFSIWPDADAMAAFARADGPHARAIRAVRSGDWFAEELYARFRVTGSAGTWRGADPLAAMNAAA